MDTMNAESRRPGLYSRALAGAALVLLTGLALAAAVGGCGVLTQFHITNETGNDVSVTSGHTQKTVRIADHKTVAVPHTSGDVTVTLPDGKAWVYRNLSPLDLEGTPFAVCKKYTFFGVQDGYVFRASWIVKLVLDKTGRLHVIPADGKEKDVYKVKQPEGFPLEPGGEGGRSRANGVGGDGPSCPSGGSGGGKGAGEERGRKGGQARLLRLRFGGKAFG